MNMPADIIFINARKRQYFHKHAAESGCAQFGYFCCFNLANAKAAANVVNSHFFASAGNKWPAKLTYNIAQEAAQA
jgi:hypothetical protein